MKSPFFFLLLFTTISFSCQDPQPEPGAVLWKFDIGDALWAPIHANKGKLFFGCDDMNFYCLDPETRLVEWTFETGGKVRSGAIIYDERVAFASDDGFVYAVDKMDGEENWKFRIDSTDTPRREPAFEAPYEYDYLHSSPVYDQGKLYVGSRDGRLYCLNAENGSKIWDFQTGERIRSTPLVHNGLVNFGSWDGNLYALNAQTGEVNWHFSTGGIIQSSPAIGEGRVYTGSRAAKIFALDAMNGEELWNYAHEDGSWVESSPVYEDGRIYIGSSDALKMQVLKASSGEEIWQFRTEGWTWGKPLLSGKSVFIGGMSAYPYYFEGVDLERGFYSINKHTGESNWSIQTDSIPGYVTGGIHTAYTLHGDILYIGDLDGFIYALAL